MDETKNQKLKPLNDNKDKECTKIREYCSVLFLPFKLYYFSFFAAIGIIIPYTSIFLKLLGQSPLKIGIISGFRPILAFFIAVLWGIIVDKYKIRRCIFLTSIFCWGIFFFSLYMLPMPMMNTDCSRILEMKFSRPKLKELTLQWKSRTRRETSEKISSNLESADVEYLYSKTTNEDNFLKNEEKVTESVNNTFELDPIASSFAKTPLLLKRDIGNDFTKTLFDLFLSIPPDLKAGNFVWSDEETNLLQEDLTWLYEPESLSIIFILCLFLICFGEICQPPASFLADAACLDLLRENEASGYPQQRAWGALGWAILALLAGLLLTTTRETEVLCDVPVTFSNYKVIAVLFVIVITCAFISGLFISFEKPTDESKLSAHDTFSVLRVFANAHYGSWICAIFYVGFCNGIIWGFLFWHLENLGATQFLLGVDSFITFITEFFVFHVTGWIISKLGHIGVIYLSLSCYFIRFVIYGIMVNPWWVISADILQGFTFSVCWSSFAAYATAAVPSVSTGCIIGIVHGTFFGLGNGLGHLFGGIFIQFFGARHTFYGMAIATVVCLAVFIIVQSCSVKPTFNHFDYEEIDDRKPIIQQPADKQAQAASTEPAD